MMEHDATARLGLPLLATGQAGKEGTHNEALALVDLVVGAGVEAIGVDAPPADAAIGQAWIVGSAPTGVWEGRAGALAGWTGGGWRFVTPFEGLSVWIIAEKLHARFTDGGWVAGDVRASRVLVGGVPVLGPRGAAITTPAGGATVDLEARAAVGTVLEALRAHGLIGP
ncbi:DUF2793 domain-containing protein [uncultured Sphingomonas sp.]|uniref:DUF2793 domain-containing protein n=1 Tax=uncultured Sphingomonas sp. TaxID=158754 RepID=UPI0035CA6DD3